MCDCGSETETTDHFFLRCLFLAINRQKLLNDLLKIDPPLRNLKDELLLDIILYGLTSIRTLLTRKYFFIQLVLSNIPSALKEHYLTTNLILLLFLYFFLGNFIWNTAYSVSHPSILIIHHFNILVSKHKVLIGSKHLSVPHFAKRVLTESDVSCNILIHVFCVSLICIGFYHVTLI